MGKAKPYYLFVIYPLIITLLFLGIPVSGVAQGPAQERLTITTYYPAPFGVYKEMRITEQLLIDETKGLSVRLADETRNQIFQVDAQGIEFISPIFMNVNGVRINLAQRLQQGEDYDWLQTTQIMRNQIGVESIYDIARTISFAMIFLGGHIYAAMVWAMIVAADIAMGFPTPIPPPTWWP